MSIYLELDAPGDRAVVAFCGTPHTHEEGGASRVLINAFVRGDLSMRVFEGDEVLFHQLSRVRDKYGLRDQLFEVERVSATDVAPQYAVLPDRRIPSRVRTAIGQTSLYDLAALARGGLDETKINRPPEPPAPSRDPDQTVEADLDGGLVFAHTMAMQTRYTAFDARVRLRALVEELVASGAVDIEAYAARREQVRERERARFETHAGVRLGEDVDKYALTDLPDIDCASRIELCHARCCALSFSLSAQDLEERAVEWDYRRPYHVRQRDDGYCVHNQAEGRGCAVYAQRPAPCRTYDCREDKRVWLDFEARIAAPRDPAPLAPRPAG